MRPLLFCLSLLLAPWPVHAGETSPYAGWQHRPIKSLSDQQIADLRVGRGLALSLSAELNGYPGPRHVIDLTDALHLSPEQRTATKQLIDSMNREAIAAGEAVIAAEQKLDAVFASGAATAESIDAASQQAALAQGQLRAAHLRHHLAMRQTLTAEQVAAYDRLRGYAVTPPEASPPAQQHHHHR